MSRNHKLFRKAETMNLLRDPRIEPDVLEWEQLFAEDVVSPDGRRVHAKWVPGASPNCWHAAFFSEDVEYEMSIAAFAVVYLIIHVISTRISKRVGPPLSLRPTVVGSTIHGVTTAVASVTVVAMGPEYYWIWQRIVVPSSIGYFVSDFLTYCIPKADILIAFHHLVMIWCHYPVGEELGAWWGGAGNIKWVTWLSMMGYTSEFSVPLLSARWWLVQTLNEHTVWFSMLGVSIVISFAVRCVLMTYLLCFQVLPRWARYWHYHQIGAFAILVMGHSVICLLSFHWLQTLLRGGLGNYLTFKQRPKGESFSFRSSFVQAAPKVPKAKTK